MISKEILYLKVKTIAIICLFISYANSSSAEVIGIEGGKRRSVIIVYETDATLEKSISGCDVLSNNGNIIGMGLARSK